MDKKEEMAGTDVAKLINNGAIKNLADINWEEATDWWEEDIAKKIIDAINDRELKPFIIDAMLSEWEYKKRKTIKGGYNITFYNSLHRLKKYIGDYSLFNIDTIKKQNQELTQMKQDIKRLKEKVFVIPDELNTDKAKKIYPKAVKAELMQPLSDGSGYQWNGSNALLAYLCGKIYCGDRIEQDTVSKEWILKRGETFFPETALMSFFVNKEKQPIKNLGQSRLQMQRPPKGYKEIDGLFDEAT